jgi:drug/metabolite transporter (DMT)-like permease
MRMKFLAGIAFLFNAFLYGTYYSVSKEAMAHVDPIVFTFFVMIILLPAALCILAFSWRQLNWQTAKSGMLLGSCLCLGLFILAVALKHNSATSTAFFPSLNGLLAAIVALLFLRQRISWVTWLAGIISVGGALLLILNTPMGGLRGSAIAFIGSLFCGFYVFLADHEQRDPGRAWALFGAQLLTMSTWACLLALLFGDWSDLHPTYPDVMAVLYIAFGTTFLPILITVLLQKYISPVTVSFLYILEPILGALVAYLYLQETLPLIGYLGGALVVAGTLFNALGTAQSPTSALTTQAARQQAVARSRQTGVSVSSPTGAMRWQDAPTASATGPLLPLLCAGLGFAGIYWFGGFPPASWFLLYGLLLQQTALPATLPLSLLIAQALSWGIAWGALGGMAWLTCYRYYCYLMRPRWKAQRLVRSSRETRPLLLSAAGKEGML